MARFFDVVLNVPLNQTFTYTETASGTTEKIPEIKDSQNEFLFNGENSSEKNKRQKKESLAKQKQSTLFYESNELFGRRVEVRFGNRKLTGIIVEVYNELPETCKARPEKIRPVDKVIDDESILTHELYETARWLSHYYIAPVGECVFSIIPSGRRETETPGFSFIEDENSYAKKQLSDEQINAVNGILNDSGKLSEGKKNLFHYLYGMTGSGKTEVFLTAAEKILENGKGVIYLVPEIGLTPQVVEAVIQRFGNTAAVLHSGLTPSQKLNEWKRILHREARVVVGARSGVFAPVPDLGLIIIDEEHDSSYKSGSSPRYHARQVAMYRASKKDCPLVMGSATPSVEAWHLMNSGLLIKHTLNRRLAGGSLPEIRSINLSEANETEGCISNELQKEMQETLSNHKQIILFLNRRGFTHFFRCNSCGYEMKCKNCSVSMTFHKNEKRLRCHYCGYSVSPPQQCPECGSLDVGYSGFGTEFIEAEVNAKFPNAKVMRIDTDSLTHKGELQEKIDAFKKGEYDILLGTQMVAKGLNFPKLQLVGVVLADTALHLPDFRASERCFSLITQVAGRAGRFFPDGKVLVQSYSPEREPIFCAVSGKINDFYDSELSMRQLLGFPPFTRLLRLVFRSKIENAARNAVNGAYEILKNSVSSDVEILGPAECPIEKVNNNFRMQILLRGTRISVMQEAVSKFIWGYKAPSDVYIEVDVDPVNLL